MNKTILILAFHFPPVATSSGMQRALKTVRYLREEGWQPVVLTVSPRAYSKITEGQLSEIPDDVPVHRAFCLDSTRHLAVQGRYISYTALPDPWISWFPAAVLAGRRLIRRYRPSIMWSTFPITTTNLVALHLSKVNNLPWVADFRDPMSMAGYPSDPMRFRCARWIERKTVERARRTIFTAEYTRKMYEERYPGLESKALVIPNGYDEANFPNDVSARKKTNGGRLTIVHSGAMQPDGRNPTVFFQALRRLKQQGKISAQNIQIVFRACGFEQEYAKLAKQLNVSDLVTFGDYRPYSAAIQEMVSADGLLVFQGTVYNHAVPAKLYEYLYARKPIFALVDKAGETESVLRSLGITSLAQIDNIDETVANFRHYVSTLISGTYSLPEASLVHQFSRRRQVSKLSQILEAELLR